MTPDAESAPDMLGVVVCLLAFLTLEVYLLVRFRSGKGWDQRRLAKLDHDMVPSEYSMRNRSVAELFVRGGFAAPPLILAALGWLVMCAGVAMADAGFGPSAALPSVGGLVTGVVALAVAVKEWRRPSRWNTPPAWLAKTRWWYRFERRM